MTDDSASARRSYMAVLLVWVGVLLSLYAFQQYFR